MKTTDAVFEFPVLGLGAENDVWGFADLRQLTSCGPRTLKNDMQRGMELVDARGRRWRVAAIRRIGRAMPLLFWWLSSLLKGTPQSRIEQELEPLEPLGLQEVRERVCSAIRAHPEFWCEDDEHETVLVERLSEVRSATSIAEIHDVLGLDTFESY